MTTRSYMSQIGLLAMATILVLAAAFPADAQSTNGPGQERPSVANGLPSFFGEFLRLPSDNTGTQQPQADTSGAENAASANSNGQGADPEPLVAPPPADMPVNTGAENIISNPYSTNPPPVQPDRPVRVFGTQNPVSNEPASSLGENMSGLAGNPLMYRGDISPGTLYLTDSAFPEELSTMLLGLAFALAIGGYLLLEQRGLRSISLLFAGRERTRLSTSSPAPLR